MDFTLSEEQQQLYKSLVAFARDVVEPEAGARDREGRFDRTVWDACGEVGLTGICISEEYGGGGAGARCPSTTWPATTVTCTGRPASSSRV